ncbi:MAG: hypothetical protein KatS3mg112_1236 [Thermogutta sp.]|nr:MAG: hypothetical protein KatS3mg112_1236 [Thermogutta sp.]
MCLRRGLKSLAESGAKAPHSSSRRDLLVRSAFNVGSSIRFTGHDKRAPPKYASEGPACQVRSRRDVLVTSAFPTLDHPLAFGGD